MNKQSIIWHDPRTPKICATCVHPAQVGDGEWICLKRTKVKDETHGGQPFLVAINLYANAAKCFYWEKGAELEQSSTELPDLTDKELAALRRK
jgi:hypothetical protein